MIQKTALVQTRVSPALRKQLEVLASSEGMKVSELLRLMIDQVTEGVEVDDDKSRAAKPKREAKVTVRLPGDVVGHLADDANNQGVTPSTWAATILMAKFRKAPQPVKPQRKAIRRAFRQLRGMATNTNQMAKLMNRGVFTGNNYAPTRSELMKLRDDVAMLRADLALFAGGQFEIQKVEVGGDD